LRSGSIALVLLAASAGGGCEGPGAAPPAPAAEGCAAELDRCRVDLDARLETIIQLDAVIEELRAELLDNKWRQAAGARLEEDRLECERQGKRLNPATLRCEGAVRRRIHLRPPP
jgi:hypothetical protein